MTGLYLHIPFCRNKCFYCAFIVAIEQKHHIEKYVSCLAKEMKRTADVRKSFIPEMRDPKCKHQGVASEIKRCKNFSFDSIYFGGGSPSQLSAQQFLFLINSMKEKFSITDDVEITIEMNPEDVTKEKLDCYFSCGVNRLSLGVQTFQDNFLTFLGRCHNAEQAKKAYRLIREQGFDNVSIDLMYGFSNQSLDDIQSDLDVLGQLNCDHVSLYSLTIEEGSKFFVQGVTLPTEEEMAEQYVFVRNALITQGFKHYEVSNFAKPGKQSAHNLNYWKGGNYIGLGIGAHSHMNGRRWWNGSKVREYIQVMESGNSAEAGHEELTSEQRLSEALVFGLRMMDGVDLKELQDRFGSLSEEQREKIHQFVDDGFLEFSDDKLRVTLKGMLVLDQLSVELT